MWVCVCVCLCASVYVCEIVCVGLFVSVFCVYSVFNCVCLFVCGFGSVRVNRVCVKVWVCFSFVCESVSVFSV